MFENFSSALPVTSIMSSILKGINPGDLGGGELCRGQLTRHQGVHVIIVHSPKVLLQAEAERGFPVPQPVDVRHDDAAAQQWLLQLQLHHPDIRIEADSHDDGVLAGWESIWEDRRVAAG